LQKLIDPEGSFVKPPHEVVKILLWKLVFSIGIGTF
jgi:hypothetical protein